MKFVLSLQLHNFPVLCYNWLLPKLLKKLSDRKYKSPLKIVCFGNVPWNAFFANYEICFEKYLQNSVLPNLILIFWVNFWLQLTIIFTYRSEIFLKSLLAFSKLQRFEFYSEITPRDYLKYKLLSAWQFYYLFSAKFIENLKIFSFIKNYLVT